MLILVDANINDTAKAALAKYGTIVHFSTSSITYAAISGHPDIFFCPTPEGLIVAPNVPNTYYKILTEHNLPFRKGKKNVGPEYPSSARYNTLVTSRYIIQNPSISDEEITNTNPDKEIIEVKQGYIQCNTVALANHTFITSDSGIEKALKAKSIEVLYVNPSCIELKGFPHGFFGGICGVFNDILFINGSLNCFAEESKIRQFLAQAQMQIIELGNHIPQDIGTILFLK